MWRALILGTLFASVIINSSWAQNNKEPDASGPTYFGRSDISYELDYSCPSGAECSFTCGAGGASHVTKLGIYFGTMAIGTEKNATLIYEFNTRELRRGSGFSVNTGLSTLQCQVNGLTIDYSGPPREGGRTTDRTGAISQNNK